MQAPPRRRLHRPPLRLWGGTILEVRLHAALTEDVPPGIERAMPARHALADRAHEVDGDATFHPLLVETLVEVQRIDFDARQALRDARRREAQRCACAAACRLRILICCAFRIGLGYLQSELRSRGRL